MFYLTLYGGNWAGRVIAILAFPILAGWMTLFERHDDEYGREASMRAWLGSFVRHKPIGGE
jgi:hypothetical protein